MSNIQKTLDSLQPYVIGIRYYEGIPVVDAIFKEGWTVLDDAKVDKAKASEDMNHYILYSEKQGVGIDDILAYVDRVIKANQEREKKHDLLRTKVNELKELFKKHPLSKLNNLKFVFKEEDLMPNLNDFDVDIDDTQLSVPPTQTKPIEEHFEEEETTQPPSVPSNPTSYLDENGKPIELTEEELELLEEERRAELNRKATAQMKNNKPASKLVNNMAKKVELPPKRKPEMAVADRDIETDCDCGPDEACDKCIDQKGY
jgi:hypothetical protein